jgi:4'-phosphopantetheinyl transferase
VTGDGREIQVYSFDLEPESRCLAELEELLSRTELDRADRFRFPRDRVRYVAAHGTLRRILSRFAGRPPAELAFVHGPQGKPSLALRQGEEPIHFSLSRSGALALVAVAREGEVGVDVEQVRPLHDVLAIARRTFAPTEHEALLRLPEVERLPVFLGYWSRKEAAVKAIGRGLSFPLQSFVLSAEPGECAEAILLTEGQTEMPIWVRVLPAPRAGYTAAVASTFAPATIRLECWEHPAGPSLPGQAGPVRDVSRGSIS